MQKIYDSNNNCLAIIIRSDFSPEKTEFFSAPEYSQQVGIIKYPEGGIIKPHYHNEVKRDIHYTQEVLVIRKGKVKVNLFNMDLDFVQEIILNSGDIIFLIAGGHGFTMLEDSEMLEVKQGPYSGVSNDKTHFEGKIYDTSK